MISIRNLLFLSIIQFALYLYVFGQDNCSRRTSKTFRRICQQFQHHIERARSNKPPEIDTSDLINPDDPFGMPGTSGAPPWDTPVGIQMEYKMPSGIIECEDFKCLCKRLNGTYRRVNDCMLPNRQFLRKAIRKEYRTLTDAERIRFHNAINRLKSSKVYDYFHAIHYHFAYWGGIHAGPAFAPWHREFIKRYEFALRAIDPTIALPYWDMTMDQILPDPKDSIMWTADFMGSIDSNGNVNSGPFANWITLEVIDKRNYTDKQVYDYEYMTDNELHEKNVTIKKLGKKRIIRKLGAFDGNTLMTEIDITRIITNNSIYLIFADGNVNCTHLNWLGVQDGIPWIDKTLETIHGKVHVWVGGEGGDMGEFQTAVGDPVFFLLHGFVDFIWEMWRQAQQNRYQRENTYRIPDSRCHISEHFINANMRPFHASQVTGKIHDDDDDDYIKNKVGLSNKYTDELYEYGPRPRCDVKNCGSKYLFCDHSKNQRHCGVKIKVGGNCTGLLDSDNPCYNGWCRNLDDGTPCVRCRRGSCVAGLRQTSTRQRNPFVQSRVTQAPRRFVQSQVTQAPRVIVTNNGPQRPLPNQNNRPVFTRHQIYRTTPRPYRIPSPVTQAPRINVNNRFNNAYGPNRPFNCKNYGCHDANLCCPYWALQGQCKASPSWMSCNCRLSCGFCNMTTINYRDALTCADSRQECFNWSKTGNCVKNPGYMLINCKQSCRACLSLAELVLVCV